MNIERGIIATELRSKLSQNHTSCLFHTKKLLKAAFQQYDLFLHFVPFEFMQISDYYANLRILLKSGLGKSHSSLVFISFDGMTIKRIRELRPKRLCRHYLCLSYHKTDLVELPLLLTCGVCGQAQGAPNCKEHDAGITTGQLFAASNLPILHALSHDGTSILECGETGTWKKLSSAAAGQILPSLYDGLLDFMYGRRLCWEFVFPHLRAKDTIPGVLRQTKKEIDERGLAQDSRIHVYWGRYWRFLDPLGPKTTKIPNVTILVPTFATECDDPCEIFKPIREWRKMEDYLDDWIRYYFSTLPPRVFVMPNDLAPMFCPTAGCAVSIAADPEILEGVFRPDANTWILVREWIRQNMEVLKMGHSWIDRYGRGRGKFKLKPVHARGILAKA